MRAGAGSPSQTTGLRLCLDRDDSNDSPLRCQADPAGAVVSQLRALVEKITHPMARDDLAGHLAYAPRLITERGPKRFDVVAWSRPQEPAEGPHTQPVGLAGRNALVEKVSRVNSAEHHKKVLVHVAREDRETSADDLRSAEPLTCQLDPEFRRGGSHRFQRYESRDAGRPASPGLGAESACWRTARHECFVYGHPRG